MSCHVILGEKGRFILKAAILIAVAVLTPLACRAADDLVTFDAKPGLWENTTTMEMSGMPAMPQIPEEQLAKMPPQQRAQIEAMMKSRGGMGGPRTTKSCMTPESLKRSLAFAQNAQTENSCTSKVASSSANKREIHFECTRGKTTSAGDMTIERIDSEHVKGNMVMKTIGADRPMDMKMSFTTKWVSSDCGDVKPFGGN